MNVSIAQYGHVLLKGARHWAILVHTNPSEDEAIAYQIEGQTTDYSFKEPEVIVVSRSKTYLGNVLVGTIDESGAETFETTLKNVPIIRGDKGWHCQHWIVSALSRLKDAGFNINDYSHEQLLKLLV
ncbi:hypothetical protein K439DRAFT_1513645 [Ramaria rubella]|nr:hypothetical protein K439DRAFT_1513645 [Ramaria rubella]